MTTPVTSAVAISARVLTRVNVTGAFTVQALSRIGAVMRLRSRTTAALAAGLVGVGTLAACGGDTDSSQTPSVTALSTAAAEAPTTTQTASAPGTTSGVSTDTAAAAAEPAATPAPQETRAEILLLEGAQLDGQQFDLAATAGNDVLLWFWAPW